MDFVAAYREAVVRVLIAYTKIPYSHGDLRCEALLDRENDRYALITLGWDARKRVHFPLVHIDIIQGKVWIQKDNTDEGVVPELIEAGIPKLHIVLGFHPPDARKLTEFAVA